MRPFRTRSGHFLHWPALICGEQISLNSHADAQKLSETFSGFLPEKGPGNGLRPQNGAEGLSGGQPSSLMLKEGDAKSGLSTDNSVYRKGNKQHPTGNVDVLFKHQGICFFY